jgi:multisubunit Na+/H+ antiporter MnhB subunit
MIYVFKTYLNIYNISVKGKNKLSLIVISLTLYDTIGEYSMTKEEKNSSLLGTVIAMGAFGVGTGIAGLILGAMINDSKKIESKKNFLDDINCHIEGIDPFNMM